jgi:hypothetical protein
MRALVLAAAASLAAICVSAPAEAQDENDFVGRPSGKASFHGDFGKPRGDFDRRDRRRHRSVDGDIFIGEWPQQGDTAWRAESFNDWWHERPWRSHPAWMQRNEKCERMYWSGGGWRC